MSNRDLVSIIIATTASLERATPLRRALDSLRSQSSVKAMPIVVVNGSSRDRAMIDYLRTCSDIQLIEMDNGDLPMARAIGRQSVQTKYFGVLDDDDEYLPNALAIRAAVLEADGTLDAVATSGLRRVNGRDEPCLTEIEQYQSDPLGSLIRTNWLSSCGGLFRTRTVGSELFSSMPRYLEWTYLAFVLAARRKIAFVGKPTYRIHADTPNSMTKSPIAAMEGVRAFKKMRDLSLPPLIKRQVNQKYLAALHDAAGAELKSGNYWSAWRLHWRSLGNGRGLRYVSFTRYVALGTLVAFAARRN